MIRVLVVAIAFSSVPLAAQSLSDAARRAEEQRRQSAEPTTVLKAPVVLEDEFHPKLSEDLIRRYARARLALADLRRGDKSVQQRIIDSTREVRHYDAFVDVLQSIPSIVALFTSFRISPRLYVSTDVTIRQVLDRRRYPTSFREPSPLDLENMEFVDAHPSVVSELMRQCDVHERGLKLWWGAAPGWW